MRLAFVAFVVLVSGCTCDGPESSVDPRGQASAQPAASAPGRGPTGTDFPVSITERPCELLTRAMVAASFAVDPGSLAPRREAGSCAYRLSDGVVRIEGLSVAGTAREQQKRFREAHVTDRGKGGESTSDRSRFRRVSGVGDEAMFRPGRQTGAGSYEPTRLDVRLGNLAFSVALSRGGEPQLHEGTLLTLGRKVAEALRR